MSERIKVATVGTGYFSQFHYDAWARCPDVDLVGVTDLDFTKALRIAKFHDANAYADIAEMLSAEKPDLLDIITPPQTHVEIITQAAQRGINVICQKPFCDNIEHAAEAVEIARQASIDMTIHENFRFQPWYRAAKEQLVLGRLGDLYQISFRLRPGDGQGATAYLERQPYFQTMERFLVHETAVHFFDVFRYLMGEVSTVSAELSRLNPVIAGEDACLITLNFENGARGLIDGNRLADHRAENLRRTMGEMLIEGSKGVLEINGAGELIFRAHGTTDIERIEFDWNDHGFGGDCVFNFTRHVVDHYLKGEPLVNSAADYLNNLRIEEAAYKSSDLGRRIELNTTN